MMTTKLWPKPKRHNQSQYGSFLQIPNSCGFQLIITHHLYWNQLNWTHQLPCHPSVEFALFYCSHVLECVSFWFSSSNLGVNNWEEILRERVLFWRGIGKTITASRILIRQSKIVPVVQMKLSASEEVHVMREIPCTKKKARQRCNGMISEPSGEKKKLKQPFKG